ncbi:MAG: M3 family metallopeptidase, partial [Boseongicola sp.]
MTNPLLAEWTTPFGLPPFDKISDDDFAPALDIALSEARANIAAIAEDKNRPTFENTIEALELSEEKLGRVLSTFFNLSGTDANPKREALQREFSPKISAYSSEISMNSALFSRIDNLWQERETLDLTKEQARVLKLTHRGFVRSGAQLKGAARDRLKEVNSRLAVLGTEFTQNILAEERAWALDLTEADLEQLPEFLRSAAWAAGQENDKESPIVTLSRSLIVPFLQFSPNRGLREKAWRAWTSRGANGGGTDNRSIAAEILALRAKRAELLGYQSFADYKLETEMAKTPEAVEALLMRVWEPARRAALRDANVLADMLHDDG